MRYYCVIDARVVWCTVDRLLSSLSITPLFLSRCTFIPLAVGGCLARAISTRGTVSIRSRDLHSARPTAFSGVAGPKIGGVKNVWRVKKFQANKTFVQDTASQST